MKFGEIKFELEDFDQAFHEAGIEAETLTDEEWRTFEKCFLAGLSWTEVAEVAAQVVAEERERS